MKVLYLNPSGGLGGAERSLLDMVAAVGRLDPNLEVSVLLSSDGALVQRLQRLGVDVRVLALPSALSSLGDSGLRGESFANMAKGVIAAAGHGTLPLIKYVFLLRRDIAEIGPSLIHSNGLKMHLLSGLACSPGVPLLWHIRDYPSQRPLVSRMLRVASSRVDRILAISESVAEDTRSVLEGRDVRLVYNGVDTDHFHPSPEREDSLLALLDSPAGADRGTVRVGMVATYARWKGHDLFLRAAAHVLALTPTRSLHFYVIGGPQYETRGSEIGRDELSRLVIDLGIEDHVSFVPFQEDVAPIYRSLDIVVHASSLPEPFGRTIAEAMASGRAVIVSQTGGATELFEPGIDGVGFSAGDHLALAEAIHGLLMDERFRRELGLRARDAAVTKFSLERLGAELLSQYADALQRAAPP